MMKKWLTLWMMCLPLLAAAGGRADTVRLREGDRCPDFVFRDTADNAMTLRQFRGKYVVIDVWASWCYPCKKEYPALRALAEKYRDKKGRVARLRLPKPSDPEFEKILRELKGL